MGINEYNIQVLKLQKDGFDFMDGKAGYKSETRMWKDDHMGPWREVCIITLWDDDTTTTACHRIDERSIHAGFVQR